MIGKIEQVSIPVKNQDKALQFYTEKLGFIVVVDACFGEAQRWIELKIPEGETKVVLYTSKGQEERIGTFSPIMFHAKNIEDTFLEFKNKGISFEKELSQECWGKFFIFKDLDGNSFCVSE